MTPEYWRRVEDLAQAALEREPADRAAFLAEACAADGALREEVESLLVHHQRAEETEFLARPPYELAAEVAAIVGRTLGNYTIERELGRGGMGEVYLASDARLGRRVALKVLPASFSGDRERIARFEREARAVSALNHPAIVTVHEVGEADGLRYIVTEYVEGKTLRELIAKAELTRAGMLDIVLQIAGALGAAHAVGIIHRDVKPENVIVRPDGFVKVLDFGLAKLTEGPEQPRTDVSTEVGLVMGTVAYMSPEQARGLKLDARTDIWSLGVVLYEMIGGRLPFEGATTSDLVAAILTAEPPPLPASAELQRIVTRALSKDCRHRYQTAGELAADLKGANASDTAVVRARETVQPRRRRMPWILALLAVAIALGAVLSRELRAPAPPAMRFTIEPPPQRNARDVFALSPDGRRLVFAATTANGSSLLFLRSMDSLETTPLRGTERAEYVFWSPDGRQLGFRELNHLKILDLADGGITTIATNVGGINGGAAWSPNGTIVYSILKDGMLARVPATGGKPVPVAALGRDFLQVYPSFLPDGRRFVFSAQALMGSRGGVYVGSIDGMTPKKLLDYDSRMDLSRVQFAEGHLFYVRERALHAHRFDPRRLELSGSPVKLQEDIAWMAIGRTPFSVASRSLVFLRSGSPLLTQLVWTDRTGRETGRIGEPAPYEEFRLSPDGQKLAVTAYDKSLWLVVPSRGASQRLTFGESAYGPEWFPDRAALAYGAAEDSPPNLYVRNLGRKDAERLVHANAQHFVTDVTSDGRHVIYTLNDAKTFYDVYAIPATPPYVPVPLIQSRFREGSARVSPDRKWLAYVSDESGVQQLYVAPFLAPGAHVQISTAPASAPRWSRSGRELFYIDTRDRENAWLMSVSIDADAAGLRAGAPQRLFPIATSNYEVHGGDRFLVGTRSLNPDAPRLTVVHNWQSLVEPPD